MAEEPMVVIEVGAAVDAGGPTLRPAVLAVRAGRVVAVGEPGEVRRQVGHADVTVRLADRLVMPAMVNAHAHLELTPIGPIPYGGDFVAWLTGIVRLRRTQAVSVTEAVTQGAAMSRAGGVGVIGDIAGRLDPLAARAALARSGLRGVTFVELLAPGGELVAIARDLLGTLETEPRFDAGVALGISPHAPYSTLPHIYESSVDLSLRRGLPIATHLAELPEESAFVGAGQGPFRRLIESLGQWDPANEAHYNAGLHPIRWLEPFLRRAPFLCAHVNYADDAGIALLAETGASVAYCPVASDYFGHAGHRYRDMLAAGVNVCLGTDSILCQPAHEGQPLGILAQMRHLHRRDGTDAQLLLRMATHNGCQALGVDPRHARLSSAAAADLVAVPFDADDPLDPLTQVMRKGYPVQPLTQLLEEVGHDQGSER